MRSGGMDKMASTGWVAQLESRHRPVESCRARECLRGRGDFWDQGRAIRKRGRRAPHWPQLRRAPQLGASVPLPVVTIARAPMGIAHLVHVPACRIHPSRRFPSPQPKAAWHAAMQVGSSRCAAIPGPQTSDGCALVGPAPQATRYLHASGSSPGASQEGRGERRMAKRG